MADFEARFGDDFKQAKLLVDLAAQVISFKKLQDGGAANAPRVHLQLFVEWCREWLFALRFGNPSLAYKSRSDNDNDRFMSTVPKKGEPGNSDGIWSESTL